MKHRVLLIDTDDTARKIVRRMLLRQGHDVCAARSGKEGVASFQQFEPSVVVTEVLMPDLDGIECMLHFKRAKAHARVVAMTAGSGRLKKEYVLHLALKLGADCILPKPFTARQLTAAIDLALSRTHPEPDWRTM